MPEISIFQWHYFLGRLHNAQKTYGFFGVQNLDRLANFKCLFYKGLLNLLRMGLVLFGFFQ
ncbi:MAG: hypothetical protein MI892_10770, partial [Desulfobacterales bacterium]|nr:hypothetical protein [Desulfobacterales bacterium]